MRKILIASAAVLFALPFSAKANEVSKRAKIEEILLMTNSDKVFNTMVETGMKQGEQAALSLFGDSTKMTEQDKQILTRFETKLLVAFKAGAGWEAMKPDLVDLYVKTYTEDEVDGILAFYKSPAGRAMIAKTPELIAKSTEISQSHFQQVQPKLQELFLEFRKEVEQAHAPAKPKP